MHEGQQTKELVDIIRNGIELPAFEAAIYFKWSIRVRDIARKDQTYPFVILDVIDHFRTKRSLPELFDALEAENGNFTSLFAPHRAKAPDPAKLPDRLQSLSVGTSPRFLYVNRTSLRNNLKAISTPGQDLRVLSVHGTVSCGKTYSWHLIQEIAKTLGKAPVYVDLGKLNLQDAFRRIAKGLTLDWHRIEELLSADTKPARAAMLFWEEVSTLSRTLPQQHWLVLDGLSNPSLDRDIWNLLIPQLLEEIPMNPMPNVFPILIGDTARRVEAIRRHAVHEDVIGLSADEIEKFINDWCTQHGYVTTPEDTEKAALNILKNIPPSTDENILFNLVRRNLEVHLKKLEIIKALNSWCKEKQRSMTAVEIDGTASKLLSMAPLNPDDHGWVEAVQSIVTQFLKELERTPS